LKSEPRYWCAQEDDSLWSRHHTNGLCWKFGDATRVHSVIKISQFGSKLIGQDKGTGIERVISEIRMDCNLFGTWPQFTIKNDQLMGLQQCYHHNHNRYSNYECHYVNREKQKREDAVFAIQKPCSDESCAIMPTHSSLRMELQMIWESTIADWWWSEKVELLDDSSLKRLRI
jgi:hypothetical protein